MIKVSIWFNGGKVLRDHLPREKAEALLKWIQGNNYENGASHTLDGSDSTIVIQRNQICFIEFTELPVEDKK